jgi:hypothetical protein
VVSTPKGHLPAETKENLPLVFDEADYRLFAVTRKPPKLLVLDSDNGKVIASLPSVGVVDEISYDSKNKRITWLETNLSMSSGNKMRITRPCWQKCREVFERRRPFSCRNQTVIIWPFRNTEISKPKCGFTRYRRRLGVALRLRGHNR